jgi:hypothetical protein
MELAPDGTRSQRGEPDARFEFLRAEVARVPWLVGATVGSGSQLIEKISCSRLIIILLRSNSADTCMEMFGDCAWPVCI